MNKYRIAGLVIELNCEKEFIHDNLNSFQCNEEEVTQLYWELRNCSLQIIPEDIEWIILGGFSVGQYKDTVYVSYPSKDDYLIRWILYEDNFSKATFYYCYEQLAKLNDKEKIALREYLFAFFREAFFLGALYYNGISIHSASLIYKERGIVFSASSQIGKSTHTNQWNRMFDTPILDGDVTICRYQDGETYIYGLPWSGSSGLFMNQKVKLEAIVFLKQGLNNVVTKISDYEAFQQLFSRSFTPLWDCELTQYRIQVTQKILELIPQIYVLECLPTPEAVEVVKRAIDVQWNS